MEWTYNLYTGLNYGISGALILIVVIIVVVTYISSKTGQEFITERVIGVDPPDVDDEEANDSREEPGKPATDAPSKEKAVRKELRSSTVLGILICLLAIMILSITAVLLFQGCFLTIIRLLPADDCPEYQVDCFVFNESFSQPINQSAAFQCLPSNKTQFPTGIPDASAWCFGWIVRFQSTKNILDQLGVCTGLIGLFTTLLAIIIYLGKSIKTIVLSVLFLIGSIAAIIVLVVLKWSFAPLSYAVLSLGITLGVFGICLFRILPKPKQTNSTIQMLAATKNPTKASFETDVTLPMSSAATAMLTHPTHTAQRSSKVAPKQTSSQ